MLQMLVPMKSRLFMPTSTNVSCTTPFSLDLDEIVAMLGSNEYLYGIRFRVTS